MGVRLDFEEIVGKRRADPYSLKTAWYRSKTWPPPRQKAAEISSAGGNLVRLLAPCPSRVPTPTFSHPLLTGPLSPADGLRWVKPPSRRTSLEGRIQRSGVGLWTGGLRMPLGAVGGFRISPPKTRGQSTRCSIF